MFFVFFKILIMYNPEYTAYQVILENFPEYLCINDLFDACTLNAKSKEIINNHSTVRKLITANKLNSDIPLTFSAFTEAASREFLCRGCVHYYLPSRCARELARKGDLENLKYILNTYYLCNRRSKNIFYVFQELNLEICKSAAEGGHFHIIEYILSLQHKIKNIMYSEYLFDNIATSAAKHNHVKIVMFAIGRKIMDRCTLLNVGYNAAEGGHLDLLKLSFKMYLECYPKAYSDIVWEEVSYRAAKGGHKEILNYSLDRLVFGVEWSYIAEGAAEGGHEDILNRALRSGFISWDLMAVGAARGGQLDILKYATTNTVIADWFSVLEGSAFSGKFDVLEYAIAKFIKTNNKASVNWLDLAQFALPKGDKQSLELLLSNASNTSTRKTKDWNELYETAEIESGDRDILNLIQKYSL